MHSLYFNYGDRRNMHSLYFNYGDRHNMHSLYFDYGDITYLITRSFEQKYEYYKCTLSYYGLFLVIQKKM